MTHKGTVTHETERLILRRYVPEDAAYYAILAEDYYGAAKGAGIDEP